MSDDVGVGTGIRFDELGAVVFVPAGYDVDVFWEAAGSEEFGWGVGDEGAGGDGLPD